MAPPRCPACNLFTSTSTDHLCPSRPCFDWICRQCGYAYTSPIPLTGAGHHCKATIRWEGFTRDEEAERRRTDREGQA